VTNGVFSHSLQNKFILVVELTENGVFMEIPKLKIGNLVIDKPIVQGGMGVKVSLSSLASAVANAGGVGTISCMGLGDVNSPASKYEQESRESLAAEIRKAKSMTDGHLAVNVMGVLSNSEDLIRVAVEEGIKIIVFGAGLPTKLPRIVPEEDVNLIPIISSARAAEFILKAWVKRYDRIADGFILEGPLAGGHLGFSVDQIENPEEYNLQKILPEVLKAIKPYEEKFGKKIPIIVAGGVYTGADIAEMLKLGASGVQMGTRFVATEECDASTEMKMTYVNAKEEDVVLIKSPVGMPGRAIKNQFLKDLEADVKQEITCPYRCLTACKIKDARYCIARKLLDAYDGKVESALLFCGQNAWRIKEITTVPKLFAELEEGILNA